METTSPCSDTCTGALWTADGAHARQQDDAPGAPATPGWVHATKAFRCSGIGPTRTLPAPWTCPCRLRENGVVVGVVPMTEAGTRPFSMLYCERWARAQDAEPASAVPESIRRANRRHLVGVS